MHKNILLLFLSLSLFTASLLQTSAQPSSSSSSSTSSSGGSNPFTGSMSNAQASAQQGGGGCNWDQYLDKLADQESLKKCGQNPDPSCTEIQYKTVRDDPNPFGGTRDASWGRYQFIPGTWAGLVATEYPQCVRYRSVASLPPPTGSTKRAPNLPYAISKDCWEVQDYAAIKFTQNNKDAAEKSNWCGMLGQTVTGKHVGSGHPTLTCQVSKSGILSAFHNGGASCSKLKAAGKMGSHLRSRICDAKDIPIPDDCDPQKPNVPPEIEEATESTPPKVDYWPKGHFYNLTETLKYMWVGGLQLMTSQLTTTMMQQVQIIGSFFDAKHQLETQRLMQQRYAQAHKDYQPSEQMCEIGTFVRNLADTERRANLTEAALAKSMLERAMATEGAQTATIMGDEDTRLKAYLSKFCKQSDNAKENAELCEKSGDAAQQNADINFTQSIDAPLTLEVNLLDSDIKPDEENLFAFLDYIFMNDRFPWMSGNKTVLYDFIRPYQDMRSLIALRGVAKNSFAHIIAEKTAGPEAADESVAPFLKALMREMGMEDADILATIGENPSYFAQMEILTKKIYQHPEFVVNLYDKPANVKRLHAAMSAIKLMQERDIHDALLRREMLTSILLEIKIREQQKDFLNTDLRKVINNPPGTPDKPAGGSAPAGSPDSSF